MKSEFHLYKKKNFRIRWSVFYIDNVTLLFYPLTTQEIMQKTTTCDAHNYRLFPLKLVRI